MTNNPNAVRWLAKGELVIYERGANIQITRDFAISELECSCGKCPYTIISPFHIQRLQRIRTQLNIPFNITSGYRCQEHNKNEGGSPKSTHTLGLATDISLPPGWTSESFAKQFDEFDGVGIYDNFVHLDSRGFHARWDFREKSSH